MAAVLLPRLNSRLNSRTIDFAGIKFVSMPLLSSAPRHLTTIAGSFLIILVLFLTLSRLRPSSQASYPKGGNSASDTKLDSPHRDLDLPPEYYRVEPEESNFCTDRFGRKYLENLRDSTTEYCTPKSSSKLTCFHSRTDGNGRIDSFCIGGPSMYNPTDKRFHLGCDLRELNKTEHLSGAPDLSKFTTYWYDTGPQVVFEKHMRLENHLMGLSATRNYTILVKREGAANLWHSLMEILSMAMTIDTLKISYQPGGNMPLLAKEDAPNTQVMILDDEPNGPYFDLWALFAERPTIRLRDIPQISGYENVIIPLAGGSNPFWQGDWSPLPCGKSDLLRTFRNRVLDSYNVDRTKPREENIVVTFVDRKSSRRLMNQTDYLDEIRSSMSHVNVQAVDFAAISFKQQLEIGNNTDVLVGVHGAGLTHGLFLPQRSVIVEILPPDLDHKGFRNMAGMLGHGYFSTHASKGRLHLAGDGWQQQDVFLENERFMEMMNTAIKSIYNRGERNYDVN